MRGDSLTDIYDHTATCFFLGPNHASAGGAVHQTPPGYNKPSLFGQGGGEFTFPTDRSTTHVHRVKSYGGPVPCTYACVKLLASHESPSRARGTAGTHGHVDTADHRCRAVCGGGKGDRERFEDDRVGPENFYPTTISGALEEKQGCLVVQRCDSAAYDVDLLPPGYRHPVCCCHAVLVDQEGGTLQCDVTLWGEDAMTSECTAVRKQLDKLDGAVCEPPEQGITGTSGCGVAAGDQLL